MACDRTPGGWVKLGQDEPRQHHCPSHLQTFFGPWSFSGSVKEALSAGVAVAVAWPVGGDALRLGLFAASCEALRVLPWRLVCSFSGRRPATIARGFFTQ